MIAPLTEKLEEVQAGSVSLVYLDTVPNIAVSIGEAPQMCVRQDEDTITLREVLLPIDSVLHSSFLHTGSTVHHIAPVLSSALTTITSTTPRSSLSCPMPLPQIYPTPPALIMSPGSLCSTPAASPNGIQLPIAGCDSTMEEDSYDELPLHDLGGPAAPTVRQLPIIGCSSNTEKKSYDELPLPAIGGHTASSTASTDSGLANNYDAFLTLREVPPHTEKA